MGRFRSTARRTAISAEDPGTSSASIECPDLQSFSLVLQPQLFGRLRHRVNNDGIFETLQSVACWADDLGALHHRIGHQFARSEQRQRSLAYLKALLSPIERKNGWQVAEQMGESNPEGVQRLLNAVDWDADSVRNALRDYVVEQLGQENGIHIVDETGFVKKGEKSVGVKRQYSGTGGRIENSQVGVFLCYASDKGAAFIDRSLYLPKDSVQNKERCREAGVPESIGFATKPELACQMLVRALDADVP